MRLAIPLFLLVLIWLVSAFWDSAPSGADLVSGYNDIETLDPQMMRAANDIRLGYALFEGLLTFDPHTFTVEPGVAERYVVEDEGRRYRFHLRPEARWSNGEPVRAQDFRFAWRLGLLPDTAPPYIDFLFLIRGGREYFQQATESLKALEQVPDGRRHEAARQRAAELPALFDKLVGVQVVSEHEILVELAEPVRYFPEIAATWPLFPLPESALIPHLRVDPATGMLRRDPQWTDVGSLVGNGPYVLEDWRFKRHIRLQASPRYWNAPAVQSRSVLLIHYKTAQTMFAAYESGLLDLMPDAGTLPFAPELLEDQALGKRRDVHAFDAYGTYYYALNTRPRLSSGQSNPLADPRVRKAMAMSIDKKAITERVTRLRQTPAGSFIPPGSIAGYQPPRGLMFDPEAARRLLTEAGYGPGNRLPPLELLFNSGQGHDQVAQAVARMWQEHLGCEIRLAQQEWKVFLSRRNSGDFTIARSGWFGDYGDPTTFLDLFGTGNGNNDPGLADPAYDRLLAGAATAAPEERMQKLADAEKYLVEEALPLVPLYHYRLMYLYDSDRVQGVSHHPRNMQMFHRMKVRRP